MFLIKSNFEKLLGEWNIFYYYVIATNLQNIISFVLCNNLWCVFTDKVTSNLLLEPDWPTTLEICDTIRQKDVQ